MTSRIVAGLKRALQLHCPGRNLQVFPDDVFVVSYPKSGNTWTRFLIANLIHPQEAVDFSTINRIIPDTEGLSKRSLDSLPRPRLLKSHQYFDPRYPRVIYIVRDPRDVAVSQYHFQRKRRLIGDDSPIDSFVKRFVTGHTSPYGSWGQNVASWLGTRNERPGFLLLRYEDMIADTTSALAKVAEFLSIDVTRDRLAQAVQRSSAEEMRRLETRQAHLWSSTKDTRQDLPFVRAAKAGGWVSTLSPVSVAEIENNWGALMHYLGYELAGEHPPAADRKLVESLSEGLRR